MARHKKLAGEEEKEGNPLDISSLIDVCFLLLIYFIVATSIVQEKKLDMQTPGVSTESGKVPELDPAFIKVDSSGVVFWGEGAGQMAIESNPEERYLSSLAEKLQDLNQTAKAMGTTPMVRLLILGGVKNQRVVDVMNVLSEAGIKSVGLIDSKEE